MLRARTYNQKITLTWSEAVVDEFGHASLSEPVVVGEVYARVEQMSAVKTMATFQQMDVVGLDIELRTLDGTEPTAEELLTLAKGKKDGDITAFDNSANVNSFIIGGLPMWLGWELRARLKASLEAIEAAGGTEMTKGFGGIDYTFSVGQWAAMINAVENYAGQCQKVTEGHRAAVNALATIADVEAYDYTVGYPPKINFDTYFG